MTEPEPWVGRSLPGRRHDRLLRGDGRYVDDLADTGALHAALVRSPVAHGQVTGFDGSGALAAGAHLVLGPAEIAARTDPLPTAWRLPGQTPAEIALALDTVRFVGQPVGVVVAASRAAAEDAAERVRLDVRPLPPVTTPRDALAPGAPLLYPERGTNLAGSITFGTPPEEIDRLVAGAAHVVERTLSVQRVAHSPMEPRGLLADPQPDTGLTVWSSTQSPHAVRQELATALRMRVDRVRVVSPDIGGSFGGKVTLYPDEVLVCLAAVTLRRPVRWTEDRRENLTAAYQGRGLSARARLALDEDGRFRALHAHILGDLGAYAIQAGSGPFQVAGLALEGPYRFDAAGATVEAAYTTAVPTGAYRGYGMQEASWIRERLVDEAARLLGRDPVGLRRQNMIGPGAMPHTTHTMLTYDNGDYPAALEEAARLARERRRPSDDRVRRGTAVTASVEISGFAPSALMEMFGIDWAGWEGGRVRVNPDGTVTVFSGVIPVGQGIETTLAQIVADGLAVPADWIDVRLGDTAVTPYSDLSSQASRSVTLAGGALVHASARMRTRMVGLAAAHLGVPEAELVWDAPVSSTPDKAMFRAPGGVTSWREVAHRGWKGWGRAEPDRVGLEESVDFDPAALTFSYGAHGAAVAVERDTGRVTVEDYWAVHDSGVLVNPAVAEGQVVGGVAQGIGIALLEEAACDPADGTPVATGFHDYVLPTAADVPDVTVTHRCVPSEVIPGGFKGLGEGGTIPPPATIAAAVAAAVPEIAESLVRTPMTPFAVWSALDAADAAVRSAGEGRA